MGRQKKRTGKFLAKKKNDIKKGKGIINKKKIKTKKEPQEKNSELKNSTVVEGLGTAKKHGTTENMDDIDVDDFLNDEILDMETEEDEVVDEETEVDEGFAENNRHESDTDEDLGTDDEEETCLDTSNSQDTRTIETGMTLTAELLSGLEKQAFELKSGKAFRKLIMAFGDASDSTRAPKSSYVIQSSSVHNRLMVLVLRRAHEVFSEMSNVNKQQSGQKHEYLLRQFVISCASLLKQATDVNIQTFVLRNLKAYIPFISGSQKLSRKLLKILLLKWSSISGEINGGEDNVCMLAYMRIRDLLLATPFPFIELGLKGMYLSYHRRTKFTTETSLRAFKLMGNCLVDMYGVDHSSSYQHAFVYIRQLGLTLRRALTSKSKASVKQVMNWQFCNALKLWTAVLCAYPNTSSSNGLQSLVYPLTQIVTGTIKLAACSPRYLPMQFHCINMLQQLAVSTNVFIPTAPFLLEVLNSNELNRKSHGSSKGRPVNLLAVIKFSRTAVDTQEIKDAISSKVFTLLNSELDIYKFNISFPELVVPIIAGLRKFSTGTRVPNWSTMAKGMIQSATKRSEWVRLKRNKVEFSPKDVKSVETFLSTDVANAKARLEQSEISRLRKFEGRLQSKKAVEVLDNCVSESPKQPSTTSLAPTPMGSAEFAHSLAKVEEGDIVEDLQWSDEDDENTAIE